MPPVLRYVPAIRTDRPSWLTTGMVRLGTLAVFVVAIGEIGTRLTTERAWAIVGIGSVVVVLGAALLLGATRRMEERLQISGATQAFLVVLRRTGLPLLGLAFFLAWTFVYLAIWAAHPHLAFGGLASHPRFADFFYYAVTTAFISPPGDLVARSQGARSATMIEMLTAFALLTTYLASFVDWQRQILPDAGDDEPAA
jgi:hypothetical protein